MAVLRERRRPGHPSALWMRSGTIPQQRDRCLDSLVSDGLVEPLPDELFALPA